MKRRRRGLGTRELHGGLAHAAGHPDGVEPVHRAFLQGAAPEGRARDLAGDDDDGDPIGIGAR
ncbi:hypothetical protein [Nannocystis pusilla]|uniref:hypothetical protein n=1 Tax=Nannocystis pusilla TaxID=889268 RepID=UPI003DA5BEE6